METLIIIGIICVIVYFIYKKSTDSSSSEPLNEGVMAEIDEALNQIFQCRENDSFFSEETNLLMLIPINQDGQMYAQDSKYIKILCGLHSSPRDYFFNYTKPKYLDGFEIMHKGEIFDTEVTRRTYVPYYNLNYKQAMSQLCEHLNSKYSEWTWEYDNGRIKTYLKNKH